MKANRLRSRNVRKIARRAITGRHTDLIKKGYSRAKILEAMVPKAKKKAAKKAKAAA